MNRETVIEVGLVGLFVLLAFAEALSPASNRQVPSGDRRLVTNFVLTGLVLFAGGLLPLARITSSIGAERLGLGLGHAVAPPWGVIFIATLLLDSFASYWVHRLMHAAPLLWRLHRVHHADSAVDVSTSFRNHPLELLVTVPSSALVVLVLGTPPSVMLLAQTIFTAATMWEHADLRLPTAWDRALSFAIITPSLHRVHHSVERLEHDSNFGDFLTVWDCLFGTLKRSSSRNPVGLVGERARNDHLLDQMFSPLYPT